MNPTDLRVVSGTLKGQKIESPSSRLTHPMGSREKLALFNMITGKVEGAKVLDAYAGSGALGIEALSRGAKEVVFIEAYRPTALVLIKNLRNLGLKGEIFTGTVAKFVPQYLNRTAAMRSNTPVENIDNGKSSDVANQNSGKPSKMWTATDESAALQVAVVGKIERFDLIFADPPYSFFDLNEVALLVQLLRPDGTFVLSYPSSMKVPAIKGLKMLSNHVYARAGIAIYQKV